MASPRVGPVIASPLSGLMSVRQKIAATCTRTGRSSNSVTLVAASKTVVPDILVQTIRAGHLVYGENRVHEARDKWTCLRDRFPEVELHFIGAMQSNKARHAVELFDVIHSLDRLSLCTALARQCAQQDRWPQLFVQVNTGAEEQKAGVHPNDVDAFLEACRNRHSLNVVGLTCIPPFNDPPEPHFILLAQLAERNGLRLLSMGMSGDYTTAIEYGATHVRVGSAIFGARPALRAHR